MSKVVEIVAGADVFAHRGTAEELVARALRSRGLTGGFVDEPTGVVDDLIVVPGLGEPADLYGCRDVVRVDLGNTRPDRSDGIRTHIRGRGLDGLRFAIDSAYHHRFFRPESVAYGPDPDQRAELRIPEGEGPFPVAVLIHGGYWRARWALDSMDAAAVDLTARGYATWNIEYRRPDEHGWDAMTSDVAAAVDALADVTAHLDLDRVVVLGHSAGGQLAFRLAADLQAPGAGRVKPALAVSLAGVLDLKLGDERWLGEGAVSAAIGGRYDDAGSIYLEASPIARLPIGGRRLVVCAVSDDPNLLEMSRAYFHAAAENSDDVRMVEGPGGHFHVVDPSSEVWADTIAAVDTRFGRTPIQRPPIERPAV